MAPTTTNDKNEIIDPVRFAEQTLGVSLWEKQKEVLMAIKQRRRVAVKSGNGLGKDFTAAVAVLWYLHSHNPGIVLSTAPTFRQVRHVLWRQIHALHRRAKQPLGGELLDTRWDLAKDRYALGLSATGADQFQGFHCENILVVVDEAEGVAEPIYEAIDAIMTSGNVKLLLIGNPTTSSGPFYRAFNEESGIYHPITISALESPNLVESEENIAGLVTPEWVEERRAVWSEDSDLYRSRVLGQFPKRAIDALLAIDDIYAAVHDLPLALQPAQDDPHPVSHNPIPALTGFQATGGEVSPGGHDWSSMFLPGAGLNAGPVVIGMDVARFGPNRTVLVVRRGITVLSIQAFNGIDTMAGVGKVIDAIRRFGPAQVNVDVSGIGGGVVDRLIEQGYSVHAMDGGARPVRDPACANRRAEAYSMLAQRFRDRRIRIPHDVQLIRELAELRYHSNSQGKLLIESKASMHSRGLPSPDKADALMLAFLDDTRDPFLNL